MLEQAVACAGGSEEIDCADELLIFSKRVLFNQELFYIPSISRRAPSSHIETKETESTQQRPS